MESCWLPALEKFKPQLIFISAGFDAHTEDILAGLNLLETDFAWVTTKIREIADQHASGKIVSVLEGGMRCLLWDEVLRHISKPCQKKTIFIILQKSKTLDIFILILVF